MSLPGIRKEVLYGLEACPPFDRVTVGASAR